MNKPFNRGIAELAANCAHIAFSRLFILHNHPLAMYEVHCHTGSPVALQFCLFSVHFKPQT